MITDAQLKAKRKTIYFVTLVCMFGNVVLAAAKITAGFVAHSQAVLADGVHSFSDLITDVALLVGARHWTKPPDESHPHGHLRIETLLTLSIALSLAAVAVGIAISAVQDMGQGPQGHPGALAMVAAGASIVIKEVMYRWNLAVGRRAKSQALIANAWHHRTDALSSIPAFAAVGLSWLGPAWWIVDPVGALIVSLFILKASWALAGPALGQLADKAAPDHVREEIRQLVMDVPGVGATHKIRTRYLGACLQVDLHVLVDPALSVKTGHDISEAVADRLKEHGPDVIDVIVHLEPLPDGGHATPPE